MTEREKFIYDMAAEGLSREKVRDVLRNAKTIQRLSEAECNGDYPCDNGEREVKFCAKCEAGYVPAVMVKGVCPNCRAEARIVKALAGTGVEPVFQGDPRGACVKLRVPSGKTDDWGREGMCVPVSLR